MTLKLIISLTKYRFGWSSACTVARWYYVRRLRRVSSFCNSYSFQRYEWYQGFKPQFGIFLLSYNTINTLLMWLDTSGLLVILRHISDWTLYPWVSEAASIVYTIEICRDGEQWNRFPLAYRFRSCTVTHASRVDHQVVEIHDVNHGVRLAISILKRVRHDSTNSLRRSSVELNPTFRGSSFCNGGPSAGVTLKPSLPLEVFSCQWTIITNITCGYLFLRAREYYIKQLSTAVVFVWRTRVVQRECERKCILSTCLVDGVGNFGRESLPDSEKC